MLFEEKKLEDMLVREAQAKYEYCTYLRQKIHDLESDIRSLITIVILIIALMTYVTWKNEDMLLEKDVEMQRIILKYNLPEKFNAKKDSVK